MNPLIPIAIASSATKAIVKHPKVKKFLYKKGAKATYVTLKRAYMPKKKEKGIDFSCKSCDAKYRIVSA